jgi:hypothetical protein
VSALNGTRARFQLSVRVGVDRLKDKSAIGLAVIALALALTSATSAVVGNYLDKDKDNYVQRLIAGDNIVLNPENGLGIVTITSTGIGGEGYDNDENYLNKYMDNYVQRLIAGPNITLDPENGLGIVTITSTGVGGGGGSAWKIVKDIQITSDTPLPYTIDGLDGDNEQIHYVIAFIYLSDYGNTLLRPNDQTANTSWGGIYYTQTCYGTEYGNAQGYFLSRHDGATYPCLTELLLRAKTGTPRGGHGQYAELGYLRGGSNFSWWNETTTNITSYVIQSYPAGRSLRAGSRIIIYSPLT